MQLNLKWARKNTNEDPPETGHFIFTERSRTTSGFFHFPLMIGLSALNRNDSAESLETRAKSPIIGKKRKNLTLVA